MKLKFRQDLKLEFGQYFAADVLVWSIFQILSLVEMLMFGRDFEIDAWSIF